MTGRFGAIRRRERGGTAQLAGGAAIGQVVALAVYPLLTRLYAPSDLGLLGVYSSLVGIVGVVACLRYDQAIPLPYAARDAFALSIVSCMSTVAMSLLTLASLLLIPGINPVAGTEHGSLLVIMVPLGILSVGVYMTFSMLALRLRLYGRIGATRAVQGTVGPLLQVAGGSAHIGPWPLLVGHLIGQSTGTLNLSRAVHQQIPKDMWARAWPRVRFAARRYRRFALLGTPSSLLNSSALLLGPLLITSAYGLSAAGQFSLATLVLTAPVQLVGRSTAQVFYSKLAAEGASRANRIGPELRRVLRSLTLLGIGPALLVVFLGPWLFSLLFGPQWNEAGVFARILAITYLIAVVAAPAGQVYLLTQRQDLSLLLNLFKVTAPLVGFLLLPALGATVVQAVTAFAVVLSLEYVLVCVIAVHLSRSRTTREGSRYVP